VLARGATGVERQPARRVAVLLARRAGRVGAAPQRDDGSPRRDGVGRRLEHRLGRPPSRESGRLTMSVLLGPEALARRRRAAAGPLRSLAASLASDLEPLLGLDFYFPPEKALLSRAGGRCEVDGAMLDFDPFSPHAHRCLRCGRVYAGELHDRFWTYWYQLWLAERAVHGAVLASLGCGERFAGLSRDILAGYCDR